MTDVAAEDRPMRSHARRNRERIIDAAREALVGSATDTSLNEIARRAGVGIGTLFRHFPSRDALLDELIRDHTTALCAEAMLLLESPDPAAALACWLRRLVSHVATYRGVSTSLLHRSPDGRTGLYRSGRVIDEVTRSLLVRAQRAGQVRDDLDVTALISLVSALSWLRESCRQEPAPDDTEHVDVILSVLADGLRAAPSDQPDARDRAGTADQGTISPPHPIG
jgi:AcrR family transcriptional regulator